MGTATTAIVSIAELSKNGVLAAGEKRQIYHKMGKTASVTAISSAVKQLTRRNRHIPDQIRRCVG